MTGFLTFLIPEFKGNFLEFSFLLHLVWMISPIQYLENGQNLISKRSSISKQHALKRFQSDQCFAIFIITLIWTLQTRQTPSPWCTTWFTKKGMTGKSEICRGLPRLALYVLEVWILISRCWIGYWRRAFFQHVWKNSSFKNSMVDGGPKKKSFYTTSRSQKIPQFDSQKSRDFDSWKIPGFPGSR